MIILLLIIAYVLGNRKIGTSFILVLPFFPSTFLIHRKTKRIAQTKCFEQEKNFNEILDFVKMQRCYNIQSVRFLGSMENLMVLLPWKCHRKPTTSNTHNFGAKVPASSLKKNSL